MRTSKKPLAQAAAKFLADKRRETLRRLLRGRSLNYKRRKGRLLKAAPIWERWEIELLGKAADAEIARHTGRTRSAIVHKRSRLCIPAFRPPSRWTPEVVALLGKLPDTEIARRIGLTYKAVAARRAKLGIPYAAVIFRRWTRAEDKLLGTAPDDVTARRLKRKQESVAVRRAKLGIAPNNPRHRKWTTAEDRLLGRFPDEEVARRLQRTCLLCAAAHLPSMGNHLQQVWETHRSITGVSSWVSANPVRYRTGRERRKRCSAPCGMKSSRDASTVQSMPSRSAASAETCARSRPYGIVGRLTKTNCLRGFQTQKSPVG